MKREIEYLQRIRKLNTMIRNKEAERLQWKQIATGMGSFSTGDRVQSSGNPHKTADAIAAYVDIEKEINAAIDKLIDTKREVIAVIEQLPEAEYDLLHKVYVQYMSLKEAAYAMDKTYSWATSMHGIALKHVSELLDQMEMQDV